MQQSVFSFLFVYYGTFFVLYGQNMSFVFTWWIVHIKNVNVTKLFNFTQENSRKEISINTNGSKLYSFTSDTFLLSEKNIPGSSEFFSLGQKYSFQARIQVELTVKEEIKTSSAEFDFDYDGGLAVPLSFSPKGHGVGIGKRIALEKESSTNERFECGYPAFFEKGSLSGFSEMGPMVADINGSAYNIYQQSFLIFPDGNTTTYGSGQSVEMGTLKHWKDDNSVVFQITGSIKTNTRWTFPATTTARFYVGYSGEAIEGKVFLDTGTSTNLMGGFVKVVYGNPIG